MNIKIISFSQSGSITATKIAKALSKKEDNYCKAYSLEKFISDEETIPLCQSLHDWTLDAFRQEDAVIFVCAVGIAVRAIAPFIKSKVTDPAVVVCDELGENIIPILSGHIGKGNSLARKISVAIGGQLILTTATDINHKFAVDVFAKANKLYITDMKKAREVSARILAGERVGLICDYDIIGELPEELNLCEDDKSCSYNIYIGSESAEPCEKENVLWLRPKTYALGIGCRKNKEEAEIEKAVMKIVKGNGLFFDLVYGIASIDIKKDEPGLKAFCRKNSLPSIFYTAEELKDVQGDFESSTLVESVTGVDNVCERAAMLLSNNGELIISKQKLSGVTVAVAKMDVKERKISFE